MEATEEQVAEAIRAYVQAGKRGCDMMAAMKCAVEAAMAAAPLGPDAMRDGVPNGSRLAFALQSLRPSLVMAGMQGEVEFVDAALAEHNKGE